MGARPVWVEGVSLVLVELNVVEQRYQAVLEVLNQGATLTDVARRNGVTRQTVHAWLRKYGSCGLGGLADGTYEDGGSRHGLCTGDPWINGLTFGVNGPRAGTAPVRLHTDRR